MRALLKKLESAFGSAIQIKNFGRSEGLIVEVSSSRMVEVCAWTRMEESYRLDFLEMLSVYEARGKLHISAFVRSTPLGHSLVLRTTVDLPGESEWVEFPSLTQTWPQAMPFESELSPLFGIRFVGASDQGARKDFGNFGGFPMRRSFTWGSEAVP